MPGLATGARNGACRGMVEGNPRPVPYEGAVDLIPERTACLSGPSSWDIKEEDERLQP